MSHDTSLPQPPRLEFCCEARVSIAAPLVIDPGPRGLRRIIPITGGTVKGPMFDGEVLAGGADWQYVRPDNVLVLQAKYTLKSHDGVLIMVTNTGLRHGSPEVVAKLSQGVPVPPSDYYFRTSPTFEAPADSAYAWMNKALFVCTAERQAHTAIVQFFKVN